MSDFADEFIYQMNKGTEALQDAGYDIIRYQGEIITDPPETLGIAENPEEVLNKTLSEIKSKRDLFFHVSGEEFYEVIQGDKSSDQLIYRNLRGIIEPDELMIEPDWSDEPRPAFGTFVRYIPGPEDHWEITTMETLEPYTIEDAHERVEDMITALEEYGLKAEKRDIE